MGALRAAPPLVTTHRPPTRDYAPQRVWWGPGLGPFLVKLNSAEYGPRTLPCLRFDCQGYSGTSPREVSPPVLRLEDILVLAKSSMAD
jgi:hypothetical protein